MEPTTNEQPVLLSSIKTEHLHKIIQGRENLTVTAAVEALDAVPDELLSRVVRECRHSPRLSMKPTHR